MQNLKGNDTNELIYKTETNLQILETKLMATRSDEREESTDKEVQCKQAI